MGCPVESQSGHYLNPSMVQSDDFDIKSTGVPDIEHSIDCFWVGNTHSFLHSMMGLNGGCVLPLHIHHDVQCIGNGPSNMGHGHPYTHIVVVSYSIHGQPHGLGI